MWHAAQDAEAQTLLFLRVACAGRTPWLAHRTLTDWLQKRDRAKDLGPLQ